MSDRAIVQYKCTELYDPADEVGIAYDDATLAIQWPVQQPILSDKDRRNMRWSDFLSHLSAVRSGTSVILSDKASS